jgi:hypothetical protein
MITLVWGLSFSLLSLGQLGQEWNVGAYSHSHVKFTDQVIQITNKVINPRFLVLENNANLCDSSGDIVLITNGGQIADSNNLVLLNGDTITEVLYSDFGKTYGFPTLQGSVMLPKKDNLFYVFTLGVSDKLWATGREQPDQLFYAVVDMDANNGKGAVISKLNLLYNDTMCDGHLTAVRHGNGRDWWVVNNGYENNVLHKYLVTPDTVLGPFFQAIGTPRLEPDAVGMACFSKDGSKFAIGTANSLINVFDFDRCTGMFSNPKTFQSITESPWVNPYSNNSGCNGLCFSPNNRFLYVNSIYTIHQYDIEEPNIRGSGVLIAKADTTYEWQLPFMQSYATPNHRIILGTWGGGSTRLHVIEQPDSAGFACDFRKCSLFLPTVVVASSIANMINYDLGPLPGCDTFYTAVVSPSGGGWGRNLMRLSPNPAHTQLTIETTVPSTSTFAVYDAVGKLVCQQTECHGSVNIDVQTWQAGLYVIVLKTESGVMAKKFLKE